MTFSEKLLTSNIKRLEDRERGNPQKIIDELLCILGRPSIKMSDPLKRIVEDKLAEYQGNSVFRYLSVKTD